MFEPKKTLPILVLLVVAIIVSACAPGVTAGTTASQSATEITSPTTAVISQSVAEEPKTKTTEAAVQPSSVEEDTQPDQAVDPAAEPISATPIPKAPLGEDDWKNFPVIPQVSDRAREIYREGLANGTYADRFSKIGDCQNITTYFLAIYDDPQLYTLGDDYEYLNGTIEHFQGSWSRESIAVKNGFNVASVFNPWYNNKELCDKNESPVDCELRVNQPSIVMVSMETWWNTDTSKYEGYLRMIVDAVIAHGAVPILATKADNQEGNHSINQAIARVAYEYDLPLWNFWAAVQDMPRKGVESDGFHITHGLNDFSNPANLKAAWPMRNLTALQVVDAVWHGLNEEPLE